MLRILLQVVILYSAAVAAAPPAGEPPESAPAREPKRRVTAVTITEQVEATELSDVVEGDEEDGPQQFRAVSLDVPAVIAEAIGKAGEEWPLKNITVQVVVEEKASVLIVTGFSELNIKIFPDVHRSGYDVDVHERVNRAEPQGHRVRGTFELKIFSDTTHWIDFDAVIEAAERADATPAVEAQRATVTWRWPGTPFKDRQGEPRRTGS